MGALQLISATVLALINDRRTHLPTHPAWAGANNITAPVLAFRHACASFPVEKPHDARPKNCIKVQYTDDALKPQSQ
jgi:hypothetical protein